MMNNIHHSVLLRESIDSLAIDPNGIYIDGTFGRGGHSLEILKQLNNNGQLIAFDCDPDAISYAKDNISADNFTAVHAPFSSIGNYCNENYLTGKINGVLLDLGVSSPQLDLAHRGFSFSKDGPLDMRMDSSAGVTALEVLLSLSEQNIANIFRQYGQERHARSIAKTIKKHLKTGKKLDTTQQLADLIYQRIGKKEKKHPATRCFQALRMYVNKEIQELENALQQITALLAIKGRLSIISFHSLEHSLVKNFMRDAVTGASANIRRDLPIIEPHQPTMKWIVKKCIPSQEEINRNIRARSAILRSVEKL